MGNGNSFGNPGRRKPAPGDLKQSLKFNTKEPLNNSMATLAFSRFGWHGAISPPCAGLSRKRNAASQIGWRPLRARPGAHRCGVVMLAKGYGHCRRMTPCSGTRQTLQSSHRVIQRLPKDFLEYDNGSGGMSCSGKYPKILFRYSRGIGRAADFLFVHLSVYSLKRPAALCWLCLI